MKKVALFLALVLCLSFLVISKAIEKNNVVIDGL